MSRDLPAALIRALTGARRIVALTGAGVSAESGIETFREARTGLWARFDPRELASPEGFANNPARVWDWYQARRRQVAASAPNAAHFALAALAERAPGFRLITQNVDGLHRRAGSRNVLELHGNLQRSICSRTRRPIEPDWLERHAGQSPPPSPHAADGLARPDVVWFGEALDAAVVDAAFEAAGRCELMIVAGTAGDVQPAASLPEIARRAGARVVDVNPEAGAISRRADWHLAGPAGTWLPRLIEALDEAGSNTCGI